MYGYVIDVARKSNAYATIFQVILAQKLTQVLDHILAELGAEQASRQERAVPDEGAGCDGSHRNGIAERTPLLWGLYHGGGHITQRHPSPHVQRNNGEWMATQPECTAGSGAPHCSALPEGHGPRERLGRPSTTHSGNGGSDGNRAGVWSLLGGAVWERLFPFQVPSGVGRRCGTDALAF